MTTFHERAAEELLADMRADPGWTADLSRMTARLYRGDYPRWLVAAIGQTRDEPAYWPPEQTAALTRTLYRLAHGRIARHRIKVGSTPGRDADRTGNAARLRGLPAPFHAHLDMHQNGADCDGTLSWQEPVTTWRSTAVPVLNVHALHSAVLAPFDVRPTSVPLEVGYTKPSRTLAHLAVEGAVARWAYDDDEIHLLVDLERIGAFVGLRPLPADVEPSTLGL